MPQKLKDTLMAPAASGDDRPARPIETALSGDTAAKVNKAALAKVPGTVLRVETDAGGD